MASHRLTKQIGMLGGAALLLAMPATPAAADENGASVYLLGSGGPGAAVLPPLEGIFIDNTIYIYDAGSSAQRDLIIGGNVVADVDAAIAANFTTLLWVPSTNFLGGTLSVGAALPVGAPMIDASAVITGPMGRQLTAKRHDSALVVGDPILLASLGWQSGNFHAALSGMVNVPVGNYREGELANIAFHRWAEDISSAITWHDKDSGWDISGKVGITFNGRNDLTDYDSGDDFHVEAAIEKTLSPSFSVGVLGYHFEQLTDDSGSGATLGGYRGRISGAGGTVAYNTVLGRSPATFRLKVLGEFNAKNRPSGTAVMLGLTLPLSMKMPPQAAD